MSSISKRKSTPFFRCLMFSSEPVSRLSTQITRWPRASRKSHRFEPRKPAPPVTSEVGIACRLPTGPAGRCSRELHHGLYVVLALLQRLLPALERDPPRYEPPQPIVVRLRERLCRLLEVATVRVHRSEHDVVLEDHLVVERPRVDGEPSVRSHPGQAHDRSGRVVLHGVDDELGDAGALDDYVGLGPPAELLDRPGVVGRAETGHELRLQPFLR